MLIAISHLKNRKKDNSKLALDPILSYSTIISGRNDNGITLLWNTALTSTSIHDSSLSRHIMVCFSGIE